MKKFGRLLILSLLVVGPVIASFAQAQEPSAANQSVAVDVFERKECSHCIDEKAFLTDLEQEIPGIFLVTYHDIAESAERDAFAALAEQMEFSKATPITVINGI